MSRRNSKDTLVSVKIGMDETPFQPMLDALSESQSWYNWAGFKAAHTLREGPSEYFAIRSMSTLMDLSPMCKYRITGPDTIKVMNRLAIRDVSKIRIGRVGYTLWCDEAGMVIDDGTIFRFGETDMVLMCQGRMMSWLLDLSWGFDVIIEDVQHSLCGLALQGPTSFSVLKDAGFESVADMKPFDLNEVEPGLWISRTGFTGDLGYEITTTPDQAAPLWQRLWQAGKRWGLVAIGTDALETARIEAGYLAPGVDFFPVHTVSRLDRGRTPFELGFGKMVNFGKGHFNGRRALLKHAKSGPRYHLVKLDFEGDAPATDALIYAGNTFIGTVRSAAWSPTFKRNIAIADLKAPWGCEKKSGIWAEIYVNREGDWQKRKAKATVVDGPFMAIPRARQTPPACY